VRFVRRFSAAGQTSAANAASTIFEHPLTDSKQDSLPANRMTANYRQ
jgi:hypothetical protein